MDDDWDNDTSAVSTSGSGMGGGGGFGRGRGFIKGDSQPGGSAGGFGRGKGFGEGPKVNGFGGNEWDSNNNGDKGGFGRGGGGFQGKDDHAPRGGGFGGGRGDSTCYKCNETGHMARECPNNQGGGGRGGGDRACYKCQETGHMARDCPNNEGGNRGGFGGGGGGSQECYKCHETGHMARDCPSGGGSRGGFGGGGGGGGFGGSGGGDRECYKCHETGHMARECPNAESSGGGSRGGFGGGGGGSDRECYKCHETGHMARECPNAESSGGGSRGGFGGGGGGGGGDRECFKCHETGHMARDCPNAEGDGKKGDGTGGDSDKPREIYIPPEPSQDEEEIFSKMKTGINFEKYDEIPVECTGLKDVISEKETLRSFDQADLHDTIRENVTRAKYEKPTPVQKWAIPIISKGRDLMACAQTGSGKTAAFLLPVLTGMLRNGIEGSQFSEIQEPQALVVAPTRELIIQIKEEARKFSHKTMIRAVEVYGGTSVGHQLSQISRGAHIVCGTPGRLMDFIEKRKIGLEKLKYLILDEADRMLDMGFEPEIRKLVEKMGMPAKGDRQTLMFSATFPKEIQKLAQDFLSNYLFVTVGQVGGANTDIEQYIYEVTKFEKREKLVEILNDSGTNRVLVFVETKRNADFLASYLSQSQFPSTSIHGDRLQREREEALRDFKRGVAPILVATSVAARGLDIPEVTHVVNYDLPSREEDYVHRIGRTGRCGNLGKATSFFDPEHDMEMARPIVKILQDAHQEVPDWLENHAQESVGTGFGATSFASKDTRKFASSGGGGWDDGGGSAPAAAADEDESWD